LGKFQGKLRLNSIYPKKRLLCGQTADLWSYEMSLSDETSMLNGARDEGVAGKLKAMGMPPEQITAVTGLSPADIGMLQ
jgi:hypothetical protein